MARVLANSRNLADRTVEAARAAIVAGCAFALIAAGQVFPF